MTSECSSMISSLVLVMPNFPLRSLSKSQVSRSLRGAPSLLNPGALLRKNNVNEYGSYILHQPPSFVQHVRVVRDHLHRVVLVIAPSARVSAPRFSVMAGHQADENQSQSRKRNVARLGKQRKGIQSDEQGNGCDTQVLVSVAGNALEVFYELTAGADAPHDVRTHSRSKAARLVALAIVQILGNGHMLPGSQSRLSQDIFNKIYHVPPLCLNFTVVTTQSGHIRICCKRTYDNSKILI